MLKDCHREDTTRRRTGALLSIAHGCGMHRPQGRKSRRRTVPSRGSGRIPARGQDRVPAFPCPSGRQHVLSFPSPPFREDADGLHVGGGLPRQEEVVQRAPIDKTDYDWKRYPVIHIDFTNCWKKTAEGLKSWLKKAMSQTAVCYGIAPLD